MKYLVKFIVTISKIIAAAGIAGGVLLAFVNVVARYLFHSSITWASELTIYLFLWSVFFGATYCFSEDAHIGVDVFLQKAPIKLRKILILITLIVSAIFVGAVAYYGYQYVLLYIDLGEVSVDLEIPLWIPYLVIPISFAFSFIVLIDKIINVLKTPAKELKLKSEADIVMEEMEKPKVS